MGGFGQEDRRRGLCGDQSGEESASEDRRSMVLKKIWLGDAGIAPRKSMPSRPLLTYSPCEGCVSSPESKGVSEWRPSAVTSRRRSEG